MIRVLLLAGAGMTVWLSAGCELGDGDCLRMSDCDPGYVCVEGTCRSNTPTDAPNVTADSGARSPTRPEADASTASVDASTDGGDAQSAEPLEGGASDAGDASADADAEL